MARSFEPVRPLVKRSRLMSLNARMTAAKLGDDGASFAVVAQALGGLAEELSATIDRAEHLVALQVEFASRATKSQLQMGKVAAAIARRGLGTPSVRDALSLDELRSWERAMAASHIDAPLWRALIESRSRMVDDVVALNRATGSLGRALAQVERVAITRGFFVGTNARIEASRLSGSNDALDHLAQQLDALAAEVAAEVRQVSRQVRQVGRQCTELTDQLHAGAAEAPSTTSDRSNR